MLWPLPPVSRLLLLLLLCLPLLTHHAAGDLTVLNTTLEVPDFPSEMISARYADFPQYPFRGRLVPLTMGQGCSLASVPDFGGSPLVGVVHMTTARGVGCAHVYEICKAMQAHPGFTGLLVDIGAGFHSDAWYIARKPYQDVSDLTFPVSQMTSTVWDEIKEFVGDEGEGDVWVEVDDLISVTVQHAEDASAQRVRFTFIALWSLIGLLVLAQLFVQNWKKLRFNTPTRVLLLCVYTSLANVIYLTADPWGQDVDLSLFVVPIFVSSIVVVYLMYTITVFKWVTLFNLLGHKSWFFKIRKVIIGVVALGAFVITLGAFLSVYFAYMPLVSGLLMLFIISIPVQIAAFAIYGYKVIRLLSKSAQSTGSLEMRLAHIRMFSLTVVAVLIWFFAFVVTIIITLAGNDSPEKFLTVHAVVNTFFILAVLSIASTYAFAFYSRHLFEHSTSDTASASHSHSHSAQKRVDHKNSTTSTPANECEAHEMVVPAPSSAAKEYQIGDIAVAF